MTCQDNPGIFYSWSQVFERIHSTGQKSCLVLEIHLTSPG
ncbi:hypothetical protein LEMLEM_LOCUS17834 [Lemmus lemmus]